ncbi:MAG: heme lyase CcmF/NrfE family subunit [Gammaproteobacteria bacterium]|nr:heme lyase CcmF/NrfE family subunit [Gammaproteobacteria bacterium]
MIPELGHFALILAGVVALVQGVLPMAGAAQQRARWMALARPASVMQALLVLLAFGCLAQAFVGNDFSVAYVAAHSNTRLPFLYRIAAVWGAHEGSLLLWVVLLSGCGVLAAFTSRAFAAPFVARLLAVLGLLGAGFIAFILFTSNPFLRLDPALTDGRDLNPLLQDLGLVLHPPMLYLGYVGFVVAFAAVVAALLGGRVEAHALRWLRTWLALAWMALTLGIALGSWWAYRELGWGGWWFWDPVENASLLPWLVATALLHTLPVALKRGHLLAWTVALILLAFALSLLGIFLVRSGSLASVHAFAADPARGAFILALLLLSVVPALLLFVRRLPVLRAPSDVPLCARTILLLANNGLLLAATATVLLGTLYPLLVDAWGLGTVSVGAAYYQAVFVPLLVPLLLLLGVGPLLPWGERRGVVVLRAVRWPMAGAALAVWGAWQGLASLTAGAGFGVALAGWIVGAALAAVRDARCAPAVYGMVLAHVGVAVFTVGVSLSTALHIERTARLVPGEALTLGGYVLSFVAVHADAGPNYRAQRATFQVTGDDGTRATLFPEKRRYAGSAMPMTEVAIDARWDRDLYLALGEPLDAGAWTVRAYVKPFIRWIWAGCLLMALGAGAALVERGLLAVRRRGAIPAALRTAVTVTRT